MGKKKEIKLKNKKNTGKKPNTILILFKALGNLLIFILKAPYYIGKGAIFLLAKTKKKTEEIKINKKREAITALYEPFNVTETQSGEIDKWEKATTESDSKIGIILGARGSGKTAFGIKFLENVYAKTNKKCYAIGFNKEDMPSWIEVAQDINELKNNAFVLIDEGGVLFSSRDSMSKANKFLSDLILISRHKNLSILFISQNSANLDVDILRQADYLVFKKSSLLQLDFERKKIKEIYEEITSGFEKYKDKKGITYIYSDLFRGFVENPLPSFWNMNISKSFK